MTGPSISVRSQPIQTFTASYNLNLIGQDKLPFRQQDWPLPTQPARQPDLTNWIDRTKLLLAVPSKQTDWPLPIRSPIQVYGSTASYNLNLIGQDKLPVGEIVTDRPALLAPMTLQTWINSVNLALTTVIPPSPFNQFSWPLNPGAPQPVQTFTAFYNPNLVGQDRMPSGKFITDLPPQPASRPDFTFLQGFQLPLQPVTPPIVVGGHILSSRSHFMYGDTLS